MCEFCPSVPGVECGVCGHGGAADTPYTLPPGTPPLWPHVCGEPGNRYCWACVLAMPGRTLEPSAN